MSKAVNDVRIRYPYLLIACNNIISQYDINLGVIISSIRNTTVNYRMGIVGNSGIFMYKDYPNVYKTFSMLSFNEGYKSNNIACLEGYTLEGTICIKNMTYAYLRLSTIANTTIDI